MRISNISSTSQFNAFRKLQHTTNPSLNDRNKATRTAAVGAALLTIPAVAACAPGSPLSDAQMPKDTPPAAQQEVQSQTPDDIAGQVDALKALSGKVVPSDIQMASLPITEFYFTNADGEVILYPNEKLPRNAEGSIIITITENATDDETSGNNLNEIISKVYSDALSGYSADEQKAIKNKIMDEIVQANPSLSKYIKSELGKNASSYEAIGSLNLYSGKSSKDDTLDTRLLTMPTAVVYQVQGEDFQDTTYCSSSSLYNPKFESASVIKDSDELLNGEYASISDLIHAAYGDDISDEAYRNILYAIVNHPENASEFEYVIDKLDFNSIVSIGNINDLNRTLDENTDKELLGLVLPSVTTLRTQAHNADMDSAASDGIVYQISPAAVRLGQNDRIIVISSNTNKDGSMKAGQVFKAEDLLQFYSSPDGNGRFAVVRNGALEINDNVNYANEFAENILKQIAYANLDIFTTEYEDINGVHNFGVFDVNPGYDIEGKSLTEIIQNSTINIDRLKTFSFVDENGNSRFEDGVSLKLPQFNYRINDCLTLKPCGCGEDGCKTPAEPEKVTQTVTATQTVTTTATVTETQPVPVPETVTATQTVTTTDTVTTPATETVTSTQTVTTTDTVTTPSTETVTSTQTVTTTETVTTPTTETVTQTTTDTVTQTTTETVTQTATVTVTCTVPDADDPEPEVPPVPDKPTTSTPAEDTPPQLDPVEPGIEAEPQKPDTATTTPSEPGPTTTPSEPTTTPGETTTTPSGDVDCGEDGDGDEIVDETQPTPNSEVVQQPEQVTPQATETATQSATETVSDTVTEDCGEEGDADEVVSEAAPAPSAAQPESAAIDVAPAQETAPAQEAAPASEPAPTVVQEVAPAPAPVQEVAPAPAQDVIVEEQAPSVQDTEVAEAQPVQTASRQSYASKLADFIISKLPDKSKNDDSTIYYNV